MSDSGGLTIRVRARGGEEVAPPPVAAAPSVEVSVRGVDEELRGRVREALRCPYCREDVAPDDPGSEVEREATAASTRRVDRLETIGLLVAAAALVVALPALSGLAGVLALATALALLCDAIAVRPALRAGRLVWDEVRRLRGHADGDAPGAVGCARSGCGALYHAECWEECRTFYGACAVFGCGSTEAEGISATTLVMRVARMFVAAALFTPRVIEALRDADDAGIASLRAAMRERASRAHRIMWSPGPGEERAALSLLQLGVVLASFAVAIPFSYALMNDDHEVAFGFAFLFGFPACAVLALYGASWVVPAAVTLGKAVLAGEVAALSRLGRVGSYLSRAKGGKKGT